MVWKRRKFSARDVVGGGASGAAALGRQIPRDSKINILK